jgi:hypothetical protein
LKEGDVNITRQLLEHGAAPCAPTPHPGGWTAAHYAAMHPAPLQHGAASTTFRFRVCSRRPLVVSATCWTRTTMRTTTGITPLHCAAEAGGLEAVELLLAAGASPLLVSTDKGNIVPERTPADWALKSRNIKSRLLLAASTASAAKATATSSALRPVIAPLLTVLRRRLLEPLLLPLRLSPLPCLPLASQHARLLLLLLLLIAHRTLLRLFSRSLRCSRGTRR